MKKANKIVLLIFCFQLIIVGLGIFGLTSVSHAKWTVCGTGLCQTAHNADLAEDATGTTGTNLAQAIGSVIGAILSLTGVIFLVIIVWGGNMWMTAKGNEQQVEQAKNLITNAVIGIIIIIGSYALTYFLVDVLSNAAVFDAA